MNTINKTKINSLYIHIPFCSKICPYCDFVKVIDNNSFKSKYIEELIKDICSLEKERYFFNTIYIGGGTPTVLSNVQLDRLLSELDKVKTNETEFTIEGNPESITKDKLKILKKHNVNRISIGIQSFNKKILRSINRDYNIDVFKLIKLVKKYINNINVDFIYGLPEQTFEDIKDDLRKFITLDVNHISIYSLILESGTMFFKNGVQEIPDDLNRKYYDYIVDFLRNNNYNRYEVSNFCKDGYESKHNLTYWKDNEYIAIGVGASGYVKNIRYKNSSSLTSYLNGKRIREEEVVNSEDDYEYFLICNLRLEAGFDLKEFEDKFHFNLVKAKEEVVNKLIDDGLVVIQNNRFRCTDEGIALLDMVILKLI